MRTLVKGVVVPALVRPRGVRIGVLEAGCLEFQKELRVPGAAVEME